MVQIDIADIKGKEWQKSKWIQILALILGVVPAYLIPILYNVTDENPVFDPGSVLFYSIVFGGSMILILLLLLKYLCGESILDLNLKDGKLWKDILVGIGLMVVTLGILLLTGDFINSLFPPRQMPGNDLLFNELVSNQRFFFLMIGPGLLIGAGIYEELTRIFLLSRLWKINQNQIWRWITVIISAVIFGLMHMYQGPAGIISTGISGLILAVYYLKYGRILPMMISHYLHDAVQFIAILYLVK